MHFFIAGLVPGLIAVPVLGLVAVPFVMAAAMVTRRVRRSKASQLESYSSVGSATDWDTSSGTSQ